jgi:hypothetical protein
MADIKLGYDRVTEILYPFSGLSSIPEHIIRHAAERGTKVHNICESIMQGMGEWGADEETQPYVDSFNKWWLLGHKVVCIEERFYDDELMITGQVDMIIDTEDGLSIVDLKTSSKESKTWELQGAAYAYMARKAGYDIKKIIFLHLNKLGGEPKVITYPDNYELFRKTYDVHKHFFRKSRKPRKTEEPLSA